MRASAKQCKMRIKVFILLANEEQPLYPFIGMWKGDGEKCGGRVGC